MKKYSALMLAACSLACVGVASAQDKHAAPVAGSSADNTRVNERDRNHDTTTPTDQPNDKANIKLAANVRSAIVKDKSLSMKAHNVKLVASDGVVVLRGPVASADEKTKVATLVGGVPGVTRVDNQLDIAP